jgi:putative membrane protein
MMWDGHDGMGWWMLWGSAFWLIVILAAVFLAVWFSRQGTGGATGQQPPGPPSRRDTPLEIAQRRYAAGEISREEYEQLRRDLSG